MPLWWHVRDSVATAILWLVYLALVRVAILGVLELLHGRLTTLQGARVVAVLPTLAEYALFIAMNGAVLIGWALYNWARFHGPDRRRTLRPVTGEEVAGHFGVGPDLARTMATARNGVLHHREDGRVAGFDPVVVRPRVPGTPTRMPVA